MKALIVSSFDKSIFPHLDSVKFFEYLVNEAGMIKDDIFFYGRAEYEIGIGFYNILFKICELSKDEPLVIYYSGHGMKTGWDFKKDVDIAYEIIFKFLEKRNAPLIFINDCCYGMAAADFMRIIKCPKMLIGLAPKDSKGKSSKEGVLLTEIFRYWRRCHPADPRFYNEHDKYCRYLVENNIRIKVDLRWGDNLDYFLFSSKFKNKEDPLKPP